MIHFFKSIFASAHNSIKAEVLEEDANQHFLYGTVGDDITASQVIEFLKSSSGDIEIHLFSLGGDLFEASAIYGILNQYPGKVTIYIEGLAASAAAFIAVAADELVIEENAMFMIHNAWKVAAGNHNELREQADLVEKQQEAMVKAFVNKTGKNRDDIISLMDDETWMDADETVSSGFADRIYKNEHRVAAEINLNSLNLNFKNIPKKLQESNQKPKSKTMNISKENLAKLGLKEDATEEEINAALAKMNVEKPSEEEAGASGGDSEAAASASDDKPTANSQPNDELLAKVNSLEKKLSERESTEKNEKAEALVNSALSEGKILPRDKNAYLTFAKNDFEAAKSAIDELKANSAMPGSVNVSTDTKNSGSRGDEKVNSFNEAVDYLKPLVANTRKNHQAQA